MINSQLGSKNSTENPPGAVEGHDPAKNTPDNLSKPFVPENRGQLTLKGSGTKFHRQMYTYN